jgi:NTE family protein
MKKVGLALGGGAILGACHIGILRAIDERKIQIGSITGTSIGAFIAALYAFGVTPREIEEKITNLNWLDATGFSFSKYGLLSNKKLGDTLIKTLGDVDLEGATIPMAVIATDIGVCRKVILKKGRRKNDV